MSLPRRLGATYRLQLRPGWGFNAAARTVPYLARLGVETVYLSPVAEAVPGSTHGYDGTDPTRIRAELGGEPGYDALVGACETHGLGICVDHVPNHLATWPRGPWWRALLAGGRDSEMGEVFDVDWEAGAGPDGRPRVILPLLDRPLEDALADGRIRLGRRDGQAVIEVGEGGAGGGEGGGVDLPVAGGTARPGDDVAEILEAQHYRLADWHDRSARNYRRFFDIDGLAGVRVEVPAVFERTHELVVSLARTGRLSALRVDHVDGLRDPAGYLRRLAAATGVPIVVEKILTADEQLPAGWATVGTTGYEVVDDVAGVLVEAAGLEQLVSAGRSEGDRPVGPLTVDTRRLVAGASFPAELGRAAGALGVGVDALREVVVRLPQYRTYLRPLTGGGGPGGAPGDGADHESDAVVVWREAADHATVDGAADSAGGDAALEAVVTAAADPARRTGALGLQQLTGAVMAKGVEDTAWYRLAGPLALCEVGGEPDLDRRDAVGRFHHRAAARAGRQWGGLVPGTTHDTKRSEDVRCRLYALSEMPEAFERGLAAARAELGLPAGGGDLAFETRVAAQLALAILPPLAGGGEGVVAESGGLGDAGWLGRTVLADRLGAALEKGAREAKRRSSWQEPDAAYEGRLRDLASALLADRAALLHRCFGPMVPELARRGALNSLTALVLRHASPGVPDTYQGDEAWNLSLVDPDNRRPVDHDLLARALAGLPPPGTGAPATAPDQLADLRRSWPDGRLKLFVTAACLAARQGAGGRALAPDAGYLPLGADGPAAPSVLAFGRIPAAPGGPWVVAVAARIAGGLEVELEDGLGGWSDLPCGACFARSRLVLPDGSPARFRDALSGGEVAGRGGGTGVRLDLDQVLGVLPVALLVSCS